MATVFSGIALSWDLVLITFFAVVVSYSYILGRSQSARIIIATYVAIIATQGLSAIALKVLTSSSVSLEIFGPSITPTGLASAKIILLAILIIFFVLRSGIELSHSDPGIFTGFLLTGAYGFATASLIVSTILIFISGKGILEGPLMLPASLSALSQTSDLTIFFLKNQALWFTLPAILFIIGSMLRKK